MYEPEPGKTSNLAFIAWTGGSKPKPLEEIGEYEAKLVIALTEMQRAAFRAFWMKEPTPDINEMYLQRARYDAHATVRAGVMTEGDF